ncbi:MAG TPA: hypothetical protein VGH49_09945 [Xanthobacteraceae bacterium]
MTVSQRTGSGVGRLRGLFAKMADVSRRQLPWAAERDRLAAEVAALRADLIRQDRIVAALAAEGGLIRAEADELRADLGRQCEVAAALAAQRDKAVYERDILTSELSYTRDVLEPERDNLLVERDGLQAVLADETLSLHRRISAYHQVIVRCGLAPVVGLLERLRDRREHTAIVARGLAECRSLAKSGVFDEFDRVSQEVGPGAPGAGVLLFPPRWRAPAANKIVLLFQGADRRIWGNVMLQFQALKPLGQHLVFLRDARPHYYMDGIQGLRSGYENSLEDLRALCTSMGQLPIYCIGNSMGGFGALRYGLDLGAAAVLAFSTGTSLGANIDTSSSPPPDEVWANRQMGAKAIDLKPLLAGRADIPRLTLYHGALNHRDARHAARLADLPGARVIALPDFAGHGTMAHLIAERKLGGVVAEFLADGAKPAGNLA